MLVSRATLFTDHLTTRNEGPGEENGQIFSKKVTCDRQYFNTVRLLRPGLNTGVFREIYGRFADSTQTCHAHSTNERKNTEFCRLLRTMLRARLTPNCNVNAPPKIFNHPKHSFPGAIFARRL